MAKVFGRVIEEEVTFLTDPEIEFVSLVKYAANRMPFKIIKQEDVMSEMLYRVLVPKDMEQDKLKELAEKYSFSIENEEKGDFEQYRIFKQKDIEKAEDKETALVALDKENKIYAVVVTEKKEDIEKYDAQSLDDVLRAMYSMEEIIYGALTQPAAKQEERVDMVRKAISNFMEFAISVLENTKAEDVAKEVKKEEKKEETKVDISKIVADVVDKITAKQKEIDKLFEESKVNLEKQLLTLLDAKINEVQEAVKSEASAFVTKNTFEETLKEIKKTIEEATSVIKKGSEISEPVDTKKAEDLKVEQKEFKFFTAI